MKLLKFSILILLLIQFSCNSCPNEEAPLNSSQILWYESPAIQWTEALPLGNGRLGAMVYGGIEHETIQFNEETLWTGQPHDYAHEGAWPKDWDVNFKLHATQNTTVEGVVKDGKITSLKVIPQSRHKDVDIGKGWSLTI